MKTLTRTETIDDLRRALEEACGDEHSICFVAKEKCIFCHGFAQWKLHELKALYPQITRTWTHPTREQMEDLADRWQMARKFVNDGELSCDVQLHEGKFRTCKGWGEFSDEQLARFYAELCGEEIEVVSGEGSQPAEPGD